MVIKDNSFIPAETTFQMNFYSVTLVEPQSEVLDSKTSLLGTLEMKPCQTHTHVWELNISKADTCGKNIAQVLPDILHPCVIGSSRWAFSPQNLVTFRHAAMVCDLVNTPKSQSTSLFLFLDPFPCVLTGLHVPQLWSELILLYKWTHEWSLLMHRKRRVTQLHRKKCSTSIPWLSFLYCFYICRITSGSVKQHMFSIEAVA